MIKSIISIFLLLIKDVSCLFNADLFFLPDAQLFQMGVDIFRNGTNHNQLGSCIINNDPHACSSYAQVCYPDGTCKGLPDLIGSGCLDGCWGPPNTYYNYQSTKIPICTGNVTINGANMLRIGLIKGYCGNTNVSSLNSAAAINTSTNVNSSTINASSSVNSTTNANLNGSSSLTNYSSNGNSSTANATQSVTSKTNTSSNQSNSAVANGSSDQPNSAKTVSQSSTVQRLPLMQLWIGWAVLVGLLVVIIILLICLLFRLTKGGSLSQRSIQYDEDSKTAPTNVNISS